MSDNDKKVNVIPRDMDVQKIKQDDSVNQNDASTWTNKGNALYRLEKYQEVSKSCTKIQQLYSQNT